MIQSISEKNWHKNLRKVLKNWRILKVFFFIVFHTTSCQIKKNNFETKWFLKTAQKSLKRFEKLKKKFQKNLWIFQKTPGYFPFRKLQKNLKKLPPTGQLCWSIYFDWEVAFAEIRNPIYFTNVTRGSFLFGIYESKRNKNTKLKN